MQKNKIRREGGKEKIRKPDRTSYQCKTVNGKLKFIGS